MYPNANSEPNISGGRLIIWLIAAFYVFFTLIGDSNSLMVQWPWVFFWQVALLCPVLWLLAILSNEGKITLLGNGLDWVVGLIVVGVIISTLFAQFPHQARWYGIAPLGFIAALYALNHRLNSSQLRYQLLIKQGYLNIAFIVVSLFLWTTQTLLPQLTLLNSFKQYGVNIGFDFSVLELRNWAPIGHQNYVAGYLLLVIPLLVSLSILDTSKRRWLWLTGVGLGLLDLYTTSSKGGWLGLVGLSVFTVGILLLKSSLPRLWLGLGSVISFIILLILVLANNRLLTLIKALSSGQAGGELAYRLINANLGWRMGIEHPLSGIGLGNVPLLYQKYRPIWAGRESELAYQLHSTPVQLWAEMGIWGILPVLGGIILLTYCLFRYPLPKEKTDQILILSLSGALFGYMLMSLTDYQLDNLCISATIVVYIACLASIYRLHPVRGDYFSPNKSAHNENILPSVCDKSIPPNQGGNISYSEKSTQKENILPSSRRRIIPPNPPYKGVKISPRVLVYGGVGILLAVIIWLFPINRAWQLSSQGFMALSDKKIDIFVKYLTQSQQLAPWESYYPYQLGWNLGNLALTTSNSQLQLPLLSQSIGWFEKANKVSPWQEFGYSSLGWLILNNDPEKATQNFSQAVKLIPAKRGLMYGLGLSLLTQNKTELGIEAIALEGLRDPLLMSSPLWRSPQLQRIYNQVLERMNSYYTELIQKNSQSEGLNTYLHSARGGLNWWQGKLTEAHQDLDNYGSPLSKVMLKIAEGKSPESVLSELPLSPATLILKAWSDTQQRPILIQQAWIESTQQELSPELKQDLLNSLEKSGNFEQWIKQNAPVLQYRRQRAGFGVLSRHIDGPIPLDFFPVVENVAMTTWFSELLPSPIYDPELDLAMQPLRDNLWQQVDKN